VKRSCGPRRPAPGSFHFNAGRGSEGALRIGM
jgi:hypothetical protein